MMKRINLKAALISVSFPIMLSPTLGNSGELDTGDPYSDEGYTIFESHSDKQGRYSYRIPAVVTVN